MSVKALSKVWEGSAHAGTELLMLLAIADFADDAGRAYPSVAGLAEKCRMKPRNANYILANLQRSGELKVLVNQGPKGTNMYQIDFAAMPSGDRQPLQRSAGDEAPAGVQGNAGVKSRKGLQHSAGQALQSGAPPQRRAPLQRSAPTPAMECAKPLHHSADEPSLNRQEPKTARKRAAPMALMSVDDLVTAGVDPQHAADWLAVRKVKKLPLTATAWADTRGEAAKAGITVAEAIQRAATAGWAGFKAAWLRPRGEDPRRSGPGGSRPPSLDCEEQIR